MLFSRKIWNCKQYSSLFHRKISHSSQKKPLEEFSHPREGVFVGRIWRPEVQGPSVVAIWNGYIYDITVPSAGGVSTMAQLFSRDQKEILPLLDKVISTINNSKQLLKRCLISSVEALSINSYQGIPTDDLSKTHLLSPIDLQCILACGVTFTQSLLERFVEEQAKGDPKRSSNIRASLLEDLDFHVHKRIRPGSKEAEILKVKLTEKGLWSQYLEVGLGKDNELFTKSQILSSVGYGQSIGIKSLSKWNNPEPEIVLIVNGKKQIVGATIGNDVNLRDFEGRSALLLGRAKDNNGSCAIGPYIRLIDDSTYTLDSIRNEELEIEIIGKVDGFNHKMTCQMRMISRDILELVQSTINDDHQYPDGFALFTGTQFAPTMDRDVDKSTPSGGGGGGGFFHKPQDVVKITSMTLGSLLNPVDYCHRIPKWTFGIQQLMKNLNNRNLI